MPTLPKTRREFIKNTAAATLVATVASPALLRGELQNNNKLKIGLVGCGGRGTGAANQALGADKNTELYAVADISADKVEAAAGSLQRIHGDRAVVHPDRRFVGLEGYRRVVESCDVVLLGTPPGFRPQHLKAAIEAGRHVFAEKPMATDAPGVRSVLESAALAKKKNLAIVAGFDWRYNFARRELIRRLHQGELGPIRSMYVTCCVSAIKTMPPESSRPAGMSDVEWQVRNWYNFAWLSGDTIVENCCHSIDRMLWMMKDVPPAKCVAVGGRQIPNPGGNIYDHFQANYVWPDGTRGSAVSRHMDRTYEEIIDDIHCAKGRAFARANDRSKPLTEIQSEDGKTWRYDGPWNLSYQTEHDELFASIRSGNPLNDGVRMAHSTLAAIMGRMAAYTGQEITWEMAMNSQEKLVPDVLDWKGALPVAPLPMPGQTRFL